MAPCASAAEPKESDDLETVCASGHVLDSEREDPSPASQPALRRQTSAVGAVCSNSASTDLCGGRQVTDVPTATKGSGTRHCERSEEFLIAKIQQKEGFRVAAHLEMTTQKSFSTNC
jgi:hypothetical protein